MPKADNAARARTANREPASDPSVRAGEPAGELGVPMTDHALAELQETAAAKQVGRLVLAVLAVLAAIGLVIFLVV